MTAIIYIENQRVTENHANNKSKGKSVLYTLLNDCYAAGIDKAILVYNNVPMLISLSPYIDIPIQIFQCDVLSEHYISNYTEDAYVVIDSSVYMKSNNINPINSLLQEYNRTGRCVLGLRTPIRENEQSLNLTLKPTNKCYEDVTQMLCTGYSKLQTFYNNLTSTGQFVITKNIIQQTKNTGYVAMLNDVIIEASIHGITTLAFSNVKTYDVSKFSEYSNFCIEILNLQ